MLQKKVGFNVENVVFRQEAAKLVENPENSSSADSCCHYKQEWEDAERGEWEEGFAGTEKGFYTCHGRCGVSSLLSSRCCSWVQIQPNP